MGSIMYHPKTWVIDEVKGKLKGTGEEVYSVITGSADYGTLYATLITKSNYEKAKKGEKFSTLEEDIKKGESRNE